MNINDNMKKKMKNDIHNEEVKSIYKWKKEKVMHMKW